MKFEIWFKKELGKPFKVGPLSSLVNAEILTEPPDSSAKNGYHLVVTENDLPKQEVPVRDVLTFPRTLLEVRSLQLTPDIFHLGTAVSQLLTSDSVTKQQFLSLSGSLYSLVQAYDMLRQELWCIPFDKLRQADEQVAGKK